MNISAQPDRCLLCHGTGRIRSAGFRQGYKQVGRDPLSLSWWECEACSGWFVSPVPTREAIEGHCNRSNYNDPSQTRIIAQGKEVLQRRILSTLGDWKKPGPLLDVGCSYGGFMSLAHQVGWMPSGFDPNEDAVEAACQKGFDVRCGWVLEEAGFPEKNFAAITAIDSFCYVWEPYETIQMFHRLLEPGGVLAMRLTNKHMILRLVRALSPCGPSRDERLTGMLKGQFHAIAIAGLARVLGQIGFDRIMVLPSARTSRWNDLSVGTRAAYTLSQVVYHVTFGKLNLSPGVLLFARKAG